MEQHKAYSLNDILSERQYIIPVYQRNYAWGKKEISQLIKDIQEFFVDDDTNRSYYLGSLVYFRRENGDLEVIDGQQRHTTITLINLVLKNWAVSISNIVSSTNLKFDSRKNTQQFIDDIYNDYTQVEKSSLSGIENIRSAINIIQEELQIKDVELFARNFYSNVKLFLVEVPQETDLNHYFEIMNNRGEQLEKHEIVKSLLMSRIKGDEAEKDQNTFGTLWDACSDMTNYIWFNFDKKTRGDIFDGKGDLKYSTLSQISIDGDDNLGGDSLENILKTYKPVGDLDDKESTSKEKYRSIIDFPNFLLQVLKLKFNFVTLDDKSLLKQFEDVRINPEEFIIELIGARVFFDKYIVKQDLSDSDENKQNWGIRKLSNDFEYTVKTFADTDDNELVKLQVMMYYSNSTNTYNNWLHDILLDDREASLLSLSEKVWRLAKTHFRKEHLSYPQISIFNLYFIDFLLWKLYQVENVPDDLQSLKGKIEKHAQLFNSFKFRQLNSKEHLAAQSNPSSILISEEDLNGIGNICLISTSQNSAGNKESPRDKKQRFVGDNTSLKRIIMFESFNEDRWSSEEIKAHEQEILKLVNNFCLFLH